MQESKRTGGGKRQCTLHQVLDLIGTLICDIQFGAITLIIQDGHIIQVERNEKIRMDAANLARVVQGNRTKLSQSVIAEVHNRVLQTVRDMQYGQVVIQIKEGAVVQIDRTDRQRFTKMQGIHGEGI